MAKTKYIQNPKTGKLGGSIGVGKSEVPHTKTATPHPPKSDTPAEKSNISAAWETWATIQATTKNDEKTTSQPNKTRLTTYPTPNEIKNRLKAIDKLGLTASNVMMELREKRSETLFSRPGLNKAAALDQEHSKVHAAVLQARAELRAASAELKGETTFDAGATPVLDADLLSYEASELAEKIETATDTEENTAETKSRQIRANQHILKAQQIIETALSI